MLPNRSALTPPPSNLTVSLSLTLAISVALTLVIVSTRILPVAGVILPVIVPLSVVEQPPLILTEFSIVTLPPM